MFSRFTGSAAGLIAAAAATVSASPALANASAAAADIAAPLHAAQSARAPGALGSGDEQFHSLFVSWQSLDGGAPAARGPSVSIPTLIPVDGYRTTSEYGMREHPILGGRRAHKGIDLATAVGTPIHAAADGVVARADWFGGYGLYVQLEHGGAMETRYGHMSHLNVAAGQRVHKGDVIGYVGTTGHSTGPHLHYEVRVNGEAVNPMPYMQSALGLPGGAPVQVALAGQALPVQGAR